ncbi:hypothetical protein [Yunchengibacter salinarum]|uniref:hypothetical protein n=1 Tax=Yunchengibacter salinarum TaxID=3133399 RepID=UPI0035B57195
MHVGYFDPDRRAHEKALSRQVDEDALNSGSISREALHHVNGGQGLFQKSRLVRQPESSGAVAKRAAVES